MAHKYKLGDKYRSDFDYDGMLEMASSMTVDSDLGKLTALYNSMADVNYHDAGNPLWKVIQHLKMDEKELAKEDMAEFLEVVKSYIEGDELEDDVNIVLQLAFDDIKKLLAKHNIPIQEDLSVSEGGGIYYYPNVLSYKDEGELHIISLVYNDENDKSIGTIKIEVDENEFHVEFPNWGIEDVGLYGSNKFEDGGKIDTDYNSMTKYELEKKLQKLTDEFFSIKKSYNTTTHPSQIEIDKERDKIITLLYGKNFSGVGQKFKYEKGGIVQFVKEEDRYSKGWGRKGERDGVECVGAFDIKGWKGDYGYLWELSEFDKKYWKDVPLKQNEMLFRYESDATKIGKMMPVVKINLEKGLIYFLNDLYADDDKNLDFSTKGMKPLFISLHDKVYAELAKQPNYKMTDSFKKGGEIKENSSPIDLSGIKLDFERLQNFAKKGDLIVINSGIRKSYEWKSKDGRLHVTSEDANSTIKQFSTEYTISVDGNEIAKTRLYEQALKYTQLFFDNKFEDGGILKANDIPVGSYLEHKTTKAIVKVWNVDPDLGKMQLEDIYGNQNPKWYSAKDFKKISAKKAKELIADRYARGGAIEGEWIVYNPHTYKIISTHKSYQSAKIAYGKLWKSGEYDSLGMQAKSEFDKFMNFEDGGQVSNYNGFKVKYREFGKITTDDSLESMSENEIINLYESKGMNYRIYNSTLEDDEIQEDEFVLIPSAYQDGGEIKNDWIYLSDVVPSKIQVEEKYSFGTPDKLILKYKEKKIAQFYYNMRGYNQDFFLKNKEGVQYGFGKDRSKSVQVNAFKKALKEGFNLIKKTYQNGGEIEDNIDWSKLHGYKVVFSKVYEDGKVSDSAYTIDVAAENKEQASKIAKEKLHPKKIQIEDVFTYYKKGGTIRPAKDIQKLFSEAQKMVASKTDEEIISLWNQNAYSVVNGFSEPLDIQDYNDNMRTYLSNMLVENQFSEAEYNAYFDNGGLVRNKKATFPEKKIADKMNRRQKRK